MDCWIEGGRPCAPTRRRRAGLWSASPFCFLAGPRPELKLAVPAGMSPARRGRDRTAACLPWAGAPRVCPPFRRRHSDLRHRVLRRRRLRRKTARRARLDRKPRAADGGCAGNHRPRLGHAPPGQADAPPRRAAAPGRDRQRRRLLRADANAGVGAMVWRRTAAGRRRNLGLPHAPAWSRQRFAHPLSPAQQPRGRRRAPRAAPLPGLAPRSRPGAQLGGAAAGAGHRKRGLSSRR